jgi:hypothetical protein
MRFDRFGLILMALMFVCAPAFAVDAEDFTPKNGMFTITMPAGKHESSKRVLSIGGVKLAVEAFDSTADSGTVFVGASIGIPAKVMRGIPADERLDTLREAIAKSFEGSVSEKKNITQDGVPGTEFQVTTKNGPVRIQLYNIRGWVMYSFVQGKTKDDISSKDADAFFGSFKLSDKAKTLSAKTKD